MRKYLPPAAHVAALAVSAIRVDKNHDADSIRKVELGIIDHVSIKLIPLWKSSFMAH
jgi:hypothetical protein